MEFIQFNAALAIAKSQADEAASLAAKEREKMELRIKILEQEKASLERKAAGAKSPAKIGRAHV